MSGKMLWGGLVLVLLAGAGWYCRDSETIRRWLRLGQESTQAINQNGAASQVSSGLRKCRNGAAVAYTDGACPKGSVEQPINGGSVTIVPAQHPGPAPNANAPAEPGSAVRDALVKPDDANLQQRRMDQVINK